MGKRNYIWISLMLAGVLSMPKYVIGMAEIEGGERQSEEEIVEGAVLSDEKQIGITSANQDYGVENVYPENDLSSNDLYRDDIISLEENDDIKTDGENASVSSDEKGAELISADAIPDVYPENGLSSDDLGYGVDTVSSGDEFERRRSDETFSVVMPTEIPFGIIYIGEERLEGKIKSKQFCLENRGSDDVRITIHGVCNGKNKEDYHISNAAFGDNVMPNKKNVWIDLRWEDEERKPLDRMGITMGTDDDPGVGTIVLKAKEKDNQENEAEDDDHSKAYFSFTGDMKSDMKEPWEDDELTVKLELFMEVVGTTKESGGDFAEKTDDSLQIQDMEPNKQEDISDTGD